MNSSRMPWLLAEGSAPEMGSLAKDERVREFTKEDRTPPVKWLKLGSELMMARRMHEVRFCPSLRTSLFRSLLGIFL